MKVLNIFIKDLKVFLGSIKFYILVFLVLPLVTAILYGMIFEKIFDPDRNLPKIKVAYVDMDKSAYSAPLKSMLISDSVKDFINLKEEKDIENVNDMLKKGKIDTAIFIPESFSRDIDEGKDANIRVLKAPSSGMNSDIVFQMVKSYVHTLSNTTAISSVLFHSINDKSQMEYIMQKIVPEAVKLSTRSYINLVNMDKEKMLSSKQFFMSSMLSLISIYICFVGAISMVRERQEGTLNRIKSTSLTYNKLFNGKMCFVFIIALCENIIYIAISRLMGISWGENFFNLAFIAVLHSFALTGIATFLMNIFKKQETANTAFAVTAGVMASFGGTFYPVQYAAPMMKKIAQFTPNYWIQDSYGKVMLGRNIFELKNNIIVMLMTGILGIIIGRYVITESKKCH